MFGIGYEGEIERDLDYMEQVQLLQTHFECSSRADLPSELAGIMKETLVCQRD